LIVLNTYTWVYPVPVPVRFLVQQHRTASPASGHRALGRSREISQSGSGRPCPFELFFRKKRLQNRSSRPDPLLTRLGVSGVVPQSTGGIDPDPPLLRLFISLRSLYSRYAQPIVPAGQKASLTLVWVGVYAADTPARGTSPGPLSPRLKAEAAKGGLYLQELFCI
jgi:hypothetical protein